MIERYLSAYDSQLRGRPEVAHAVDAVELRPLLLAEFDGGRGFITGRDLEQTDPGGLVDAALEHFTSRSGIRSVEWKTRAHDRAPGLADALVERGFEPEDAESIMVGEAALLVREVPLPDGVELRRATTDDEVLAMERMQGHVFGDPDWRMRADATMRRMRVDDSLQLWTAVAGGEVISAGRLEPVEDTEFAGLWGGATLPEWRGHGIYRALTAERARAALILGKRYLQSDSTEYSRPILERAGLVRVSSTTPYVWTPPPG